MARLVALLPKEMAAKEAAALNGPIEASREITPFNLAQVLLYVGGCDVTSPCSSCPGSER